MAIGLRSVGPIGGPFGPRVFNEHGEEIHPDTKWARKHADGKWMVPPREIWPMLDLMQPELLWAPILQQWSIKKVGKKPRFVIEIMPDASEGEWRQVLGFLADWSMTRAPTASDY